MPADLTDPWSDLGVIWCCELELASTSEFQAVLPRPARSEQVRALVRLHGVPLGYLGPIALDTADASAARVQAAERFASRIVDRLGLEPTCAADPRALAQHTASSPWPERDDDAGTVSVIVCTRDRADVLEACLSSLVAIDYPHVEFIIVDNASTDERTAELVATYAAKDARFVYAREPRPGLSCARNRGLQVATGDVVAYTDDDVAVDADWVGAVTRAFGRNPKVACVTGLVCTASIGSRAEAYFDARAASWSSRTEPELFDLVDHTRADLLYPYSAGIYGTGANVAFRRQSLLDIGGFDEALGAGTRTRGGEDLDMFVRVLRAGHTLAYEPSAVVWHHHRADDAALLRQMYAYGTGLTAYLAKLVIEPGTRLDVLRRIPLGVLRISAIYGSTRSRLGPPATPPRGAMLREICGYLGGPVLYLKERRRVRRAREHSPS